MSNLSKFSKAELVAEIQRRNDEEKQRLKEKQLAYSKQVMDVISRQFVDLVAPEHSKSNCSDEDIWSGNGWMTCPNVVPLCARCALLQTLEQDWPPEFKLSVYIETW